MFFVVRQKSAFNGLQVTKCSGEIVRRNEVATGTSERRDYLKVSKI